MPNYDDHMERAAQYWREGMALDAGKLIFENLSNEVRPKWALRIMKLVLNRSGIHSSLLKQVLRTADSHDMWRNGHLIFSKVRDETLKMERLAKKHHLTKEDELMGHVLCLAELVSKVAYNATNPPDEFDEDSGWWIVVCLREFIDNFWHDEEFAKAAWSTVSSSEA